LEGEKNKEEYNTFLTRSASTGFLFGLFGSLRYGKGLIRNVAFNATKISDGARAINADVKLKQWVVGCRKGSIND
jgi:hypothetical protein